MKRVILVVATVFMLHFGAAAQKNANVEVVVQNAQARIADMEAEAFIKPVTAEIKVNEAAGRIKDVWTFTADEVKAMGSDISNIRARGAYLSSVKHDADLIFAPLFNFQSVSGNKFELTVVGYPANFVNFKTIEAKDAEWLNIKKIYKTSEREKIAPVIKQ
ncbi:MAG: hypothetical protein J6P44_09310 [Bacteroidales bacterium]|nr:hypothetical protein [Bacteroidales bacterium]